MIFLLQMKAIDAQLGQCFAYWLLVQYVLRFLKTRHWP
jgi:hypothetical protein